MCLDPLEKVRVDAGLSAEIQSSSTLEHISWKML